MQKDCEKSLNHVANCTDCIKQILTHKSEILTLTGKEIDELTNQVLATTIKNTKIKTNIHSQNT